MLDDERKKMGQRLGVAVARSQFKKPRHVPGIGMSTLYRWIKHGVPMQVAEFLDVCDKLEIEVSQLRTDVSPHECDYRVNSIRSGPFSGTQTVVLICVVCGDRRRGMYIRPAGRKF